MIGTVGVIIQARMNSTRLPGKVLKPAQGKPLFQYLVERLRRCRAVSAIVLATSDKESDTPLAEFAVNLGLPAYRGPIDDVAARFLGAADAFGLDAFVRITGDSPFADPALVDHAVRLRAAGDADLATNVRWRSFPKGMSVEVLRTEAFRRACAGMTRPEEHEHVTQYFYAHPEGFRISSFASGHDYGNMQLSVDTPEDFLRFEKIIARMKRPHEDYGWAEIVALAAEAEPAASPRSIP